MPSSSLFHGKILFFNRRGEVAIEYGLLAAMIAVALLGMASMGDVADKQAAAFETLADQMKQ